MTSVTIYALRFVSLSSFKRNFKHLSTNQRKTDEWEMLKNKRKEIARVTREYLSLG